MISSAKLILQLMNGALGEVIRLVGACGRAANGYGFRSLARNSLFLASSASSFRNFLSSSCSFLSHSGLIGYLPSKKVVISLLFSRKASLVRALATAFLRSFSINSGYSRAARNSAFLEELIDKFQMLLVKKPTSDVAYRLKLCLLLKSSDVSYS